MARPRPLALLLLALLGLQVAFWNATRRERPVLDVVPPVPSLTQTQALALGDSQFHFRVLALQMQNFGDLFGRFTALRYYDFNRLYQWFNLLDALDSRSNIVPTLAAYYFSQTQNTADVRYIVDYLQVHGQRDVAHKWWWLLQGSYLASHKLNDLDLAVKVASPMIHEGVPVWAQQMVAVLHEQNGEMEEAYSIIQTIEKNAGELSDADLKFMTYFVNERLKAMEKR